MSRTFYQVRSIRTGYSKGNFDNAAQAEMECSKFSRELGAGARESYQVVQMCRN